MKTSRGKKAGAPKRGLGPEWRANMSGVMEMEGMTGLALNFDTLEAEHLCAAIQWAKGFHEWPV